MHSCRVPCTVLSSWDCLNGPDDTVAVHCSSAHTKPSGLGESRRPKAAAMRWRSALRALCLALATRTLGGAQDLVQAGYVEDDFSASASAPPVKMSAGPVAHEFQLLRSALLGGRKYPYPLVVTALNEQTVDEGANMMVSLLLTNPNVPVLVYDLGLPRVARVRIQTDWCNAVLLPMPAAWAALPPRDRRRTDVALGAWKPFVLQDVLSNVTAAPVLLTEANGIFLDSLDEPLLWDYAQRSLLLGRPDELYDIQNFTHPSTLQKLAPNPLDPALLAGDQIATYQLVVGNTAEVFDMVLAPWLRCVHDVQCFAPDGGVWEDGAGCTLGQTYTGDYTCHLHRGGTSVVSVLVHELWYKGHLRFRWPTLEGAMPVDGVHQVNSNHTHAPPYFGQQRMLGSHGGQRGYMHHRYKKAPHPDGWQRPLVCAALADREGRLPCSLSYLLAGTQSASTINVDTIIKDKCRETRQRIAGWLPTMTAVEDHTADGARVFYPPPPPPDAQSQARADHRAQKAKLRARMRPPKPSPPVPPNPPPLPMSKEHARVLTARRVDDAAATAQLADASGKLLIKPAQQIQQRQWGRAG